MIAKAIAGFLFGWIVLDMLRGDAFESDNWKGTLLAIGIVWWMLA